MKGRGSKALQCWRSPVGWHMWACKQGCAWCWKVFKIETAVILWK